MMQKTNRLNIEYKRRHLDTRRPGENGVRVLLTMYEYQDNGFSVLVYQAVLLLLQYSVNRT